MVQDHERPELLCLATEFGVYFSLNGGLKWMKLNGGMPTIPVRDITIQRRENDLVAATFGRSFYVLDDISPLRAIDQDLMAQEAALFEPRDAWWFFPRPHLDFGSVKGSMGHAHFTAPNPPHGVNFTYYLRDGYRSLKEERLAVEKKRSKLAVPFAGYEAMEAERVDEGPKLMLLIRNTSGEVIRRIPAPHSKGFHRVSWDMRHPSAGALDASHPPKEMDPKGPTGFPAVPGSYTASLVLLQDGQMQWTQGPVSFELKPLRKGALEGGSMEEVDAFWRGLEAASGRSDLIAMAVSELTERVEALQVASERSHSAPGSTDSLLFVLRKEIQALRTGWSGEPLKLQMERRRLPWSPNVYSLGAQCGPFLLWSNSNQFGDHGTHPKRVRIL